VRTQFGRRERSGIVEKSFRSFYQRSKIVHIVSPTPWERHGIVDGRGGDVVRASEERIGNGKVGRGS